MFKAKSCKGVLKMIQLYTDSAANLPSKLTLEKNIKVISLSYILDGVEQDEKDFDGKAYYNALRSGKIAQTSMVNTEAFSSQFRQELESGNDVIYIGISGGISGTVNAARIAAVEVTEEFVKKYGDTKRVPEIIVTDSLGASLGEGMIVLKAAEMIENGMSVGDIEKEIQDLIPTMCQCFTVEDLKHLKRTGRISGAASLIGGLLGIQPILIGNHEGKIVMSGKIRGSKRALDALADRYNKCAVDKTTDIGIAHADNESGAEYLIKKLKEYRFGGECLTVCYEPVTGSHVGPGTVALFFYGKGGRDL